jgi:FkbM family methyltransferase
LSLPLAPIEILDIGAREEGQDRYQPLRDVGLARVTGFEPDEEHCAALQASAAETDRYLPYYLGTGETSVFRIARYPGCSSLYEPDAGVIDLFTSIGTGELDNFRVLERTEVETVRLDDIEGAPRPDYIKLDIQGGELDVLKHGTEALQSTLVIESEVEFIPIYKDQPLFSDVEVFLREQGFLLHKFIDVGGRSFRPFSRNNNPFAATSQVLWADAVFVRDFTRLERYSESDLLKAALVLNDVYSSYDLVSLLLREHDQRKGSDLNSAYMSALQQAPGLEMLYMNLKEHI